MKTKLAVMGAGGRMGKEILELTQESPKDWSSIIGVSASGKAVGYDKVLKSAKQLGDEKVDLVIDFSSPDAFRELTKQLSKKPVALVSGTTGLSDKDLSELKKLGKKIPVFWAPNTSLGVATLKKALSALSALEDYDFQVEEIHHRFKKDAPSGTAKLLKKELDHVIQKKSPEALAIRGGGVPGLHRVWALGPEEWLCFEHMALSRRVFARGALKVGQWLVKQKPGVYTMEDYLKGI